MKLLRFFIYFRRYAMRTRSSGIVLEAPQHKCSDVNCPFHGSLSTRGRQFIGTVISTKMRKTVVVEFERLYFLKKYERYEKRKTKLKVHNPDCINANDGNVVRIFECRPLSKTKNFVIVEKLGMEKGFKEKIEAREASKVSAKKEEEIKPEKKGEQ